MVRNALPGTPAGERRVPVRKRELPRVRPADWDMLAGGCMLDLKEEPDPVAEAEELWRIDRRAEEE